MKKLFNKEVLVRGVGIGIIAGVVMTIVAGCVAHADTIISTLINNTTNGAASTPVLNISGSWFTGG